MKWKEDHAWSGQFMPDIKSVLGQHLLGDASYEDDTKHATDLVVLRMKDLRIAVRMRRRRYADNAKWVQQFTIRSERPQSGVETELGKIISGWGDLFFYGFEGDVSGRLGIWNLIDLNAFRLGFMRLLSKCHCGVLPGDEINNPDGASCGRAFSYDQFEPQMIVARGSGVHARPVALSGDGLFVAEDCALANGSSRSAVPQQPLLPLFNQ